MNLNPWDVQSKQICTIDDVSPPLYSGECRYGGGEAYVLIVGEGDGIGGDERAGGTPERKQRNKDV